MPSVQSLAAEAFSRMDRDYRPSPSRHDAMRRSSQICAEAAIYAVDSTAAAFSRYKRHFDPLYHKAQKWDVQEYVPMVVGLLICFFGASYTMIFTVTETVRMLCWKDIMHSYAVLRESYEIALRQYHRDYGDITLDLDERSTSALFSRKVALFVKSVDMDELQSAARTLATALFSVCAALRIRLARTFTLVQSVTSMIKEHVPLERMVCDMLPPEMHKAAGLVASIVLHVTAFILCIGLNFILVRLYCALRGAQIFVRHLVLLGHTHGWFSADLTSQSSQTHVMLLTVAVIGFLYQMVHHDGPPFPLNLLLLPFTLVEYTLHILVYVFLYNTPIF